MATFALDEEMGGANMSVTTPTEEKALLLSPTHDLEEKRYGRTRGEQRGWDEIIPSSLLKEVEEDEKQREEVKLYLPPRQRKVKVNTSKDNSGNDRGSLSLSLSQNYCEEQQTSTTIGRRSGDGSRRQTRRGGGGAGGDRVGGRRQKNGGRSSGNMKTKDDSTIIRKTIRGFTNSEIKRFVTISNQDTIKQFVLFINGSIA